MACCDARPTVHGTKYILKVFPRSQALNKIGTIESCKLIAPWRVRVVTSRYALSEGHLHAVQRMARADGLD